MRLCHSAIEVQQPVARLSFPALFSLTVVRYALSQWLMARNPALADSKIAEEPAVNVMEQVCSNFNIS